MDSLDAPKEYAAVDRSDMFGVLPGFVDDFFRSFEAAQKVPLRAPSGLANVVMAGMGGSGISANLTASLLGPEASVPLEIVNDYRLPGSVGPRSVVVAISYSGDTEETVSCAAQAQRQQAYLVGISSGGRLAEVCADAGAPHVRLMGGRQPRMALGHLWGSLLGVAAALRLAPVRADRRLEEEVRPFAQAFLPAAPEKGNPAKQFARDLYRRSPVWYAAAPLGPVALRGRCQLNENAKMAARHQVLPEASHNDLVPWSQIHDADGHFVGLLRQADEPPQIRTRFEFLHSVLKRQKVTHREYVVRGSTPLARMLDGLMFVDYVSAYAALLRGVDPSPIDVIRDLKARLARSSTPSAAVRPSR